MVKLFGALEGSPSGILAAADLQLSWDDIEAKLVEVLPQVIWSDLVFVRMKPKDPPQLAVW